MRYALFRVVTTLESLVGSMACRRCNEDAFSSDNARDGVAPILVVNGHPCQGKISVSKLERSPQLGGGGQVGGIDDPKIVE